MTTHRFYLTFCMTLMLAVVSLSSAHADPLCPDTTKLKELSLGDVTDLQFDIDRLNLCVQRAKLLEELDQSVKDREKIRQEPLVSAKTGLESGGVFSAVPVIPSMPTLPEINRTITMPAAAAVESAQPQDWKIQRIWGQGQSMQAQLAQGDIIANVKLNDVLPTGEKVKDLSARGVTLDNGKTQRSLKWLETVKKSDKADQKS